MRGAYFTRRHEIPYHHLTKKNQMPELLPNANRFSAVLGTIADEIEIGRDIIKYPYYQRDR